MSFLKFIFSKWGYYPLFSLNGLFLLIFFFGVCVSDQCRSCGCVTFMTFVYMIIIMIYILHQ